MPRKIDELASDIDDAKTTVEELRNEPGVDGTDKLEELDAALQNAADTIEELEDTND